MGMVSSLKFDKYRGAVLVNEEFMNVRYRRKLYLDSARSLLTAEMADAWNLEAVYAGCGSPAVNQEIVDSTRAVLAAKFAEAGKGSKKGAPPIRLKDVGLIVADVLQKIIRRDQDLKLHLFYGFRGDDLNRGSFSRDGKSYSIKQEKVKKKALDIINARYSDRNTSLYKDTRGLLFGWDEQFGICAYHLDISNGNVGFNMEAYEALGHGKYGLETSLARYLNNVTYPMRRRGCSVAYGVYELIKAALSAREAFHCGGGNFNIVLIDGSAKNHKQRYVEIVDERSRLVMHIVQAADTGYLSEEDALKLLEEALFSSTNRQTMEKQLFARSSDASALDFVLRGYKIHEVAEIARDWKNTKKRRKK